MNAIHKLPALLFCCMGFCAFAQQTARQYVQSEAVEIHHIDLMGDDFTDLEPLGRAIGEARIVALGEQMHGDGTTFAAKGRIICYLHEKKGFNVVVFENDFFGLTYGFEKTLKSADSLHPFLSRNLIGLWSQCDAAAPFLYHYIAQTQLTPSPLVLAGMDCQVQTPYSFAQLPATVRSVLTKLVEKPDDSPLVQEVIDRLPTVFFNGQKADPAGCERGLLALEALRKGKSLKQLNAEEVTLLDNVTAAFRNILPFLQGHNAGAARHLYRDRQMFQNLMWLITHKFPNEKLVVWAHNAHIAKTDGNPTPNHDATPMLGYLLAGKENPYPYYALGITSYHATSVWTTAPGQVIRAQKPARNGFERWINKKWDFAFVDWRKWNETNPNGEAFPMKGSFEFSQHRNFVCHWNRVFDGVFFIRKVEGCRKQ